MKRYVPEEYWERRGRTWQGHEVTEELDNLASWVIRINPHSILEVGSGWGRVHNHLRAFGYRGHYRMCDFVDSLRRRCLRITGVEPDRWDGRTLPYLPADFDVVISFSVLLHVLPENLEGVFAEHVRVSRRWFFIATYAGERVPPQGGASHLHDYLPLIEEHGLSIMEEARFKDGERVHWLLRK